MTAGATPCGITKLSTAPWTELTVSILMSVLRIATPVTVLLALNASMRRDSSDASVQSVIDPLMYIMRLALTFLRSGFIF